MTVCTSASFSQSISKNSQGNILLLKVHIDQEESISRTPGPVRLLLPDFDDLQRQLQQVETKLKGTQLKAEFDVQSYHADITDPCTSALQRNPATAQATTKDLLKVCCCCVILERQKP